MHLVNPKMMMQPPVTAPVSPIRRSMVTLDDHMRAVLDRRDISDDEKGGKVENLLKCIEGEPNMHWNERGEFIHDIQVIKGSNIVELVNDIMRHRKDFHPQGWQEFAHALHQGNVPQDLVGNRRRWDWMRWESATSDAFSMAEESSPERSHPRYRTPAQQRVVLEAIDHWALRNGNPSHLISRLRSRWVSFHRVEVRETVVLHLLWCQRHRKFWRHVTLGKELKSKDEISQSMVE